MISHYNDRHFFVFFTTVGSVLRKCIMQLYTISMTTRTQQVYSKDKAVQWQLSIVVCTGPQSISPLTELYSLVHM